MVEIVAVRDIEIAVEPWTWNFANVQRAEIDRHFSEAAQVRSVWNGRVLMLHHYAVDDGVLRGTCFETDYASLMAWCDWGFPDRSVYNFYAASALRGTDGAYLVGEMAAHTATAGRRYFPCGTPEPADTVDGRVVDLKANLRRELLEETGLGLEELEAQTDWTLVRDGNLLALVKQVTAPQDADGLRSRIVRALAAEVQPEFADIHIVRGRADLHPQMPCWMVGYFDFVWSGEPLQSRRRLIEA